MSPEAKDKFILLIGSCGWVLTSVFIVTFFVVLRPSDYRKGNELGRQTQKGADAVKVDAYQARPLAENLWLGGDVLEVTESSLTVELGAMTKNPLRGGEPILQRIDFDATPVYLVATNPVQSNELIQIDFASIQVGDLLRYLPVDPANALGSVAQPQEIQVSRKDLLEQVHTDEPYQEPIEYQQPN